MKPSLIPLLGALALTALPHAQADPATAARSLNAFGLDLHRRLAAEADGNQVTSPWSIETALAMTYGGAAGRTKTEMAEVLHFAADDAAVHTGFAALTADLRALAEQSRARVEDAGPRGGPNTPLTLTAANRLFGQQGYPFEKPFLALTGETYGAPLELMDFQKAPEPARQTINAWVEKETRERIKELIPPLVITEETRLVLVNAVHLKAAWAREFSEEPEAPFYVNGTEQVKVPGLVHEADYGYLPLPGGAAVTVPYADGGLQFVLLVPAARDGLSAMEKTLHPDTLAAVAHAERRPVKLHFPSFKLDPGRVLLSKNLMAMGMPSAFNAPPGSADFSGIAPRRPDDFLFIGEVIHQAFIAVDKHGTEAAAATAVVALRASALPIEPPQPLEVRVDRPFAFAIQHIPTGACLFLGRVTDPR
jgi:serpin B